MFPLNYILGGGEKEQKRESTNKTLAANVIELSPSDYLTRTADS
jgi:hypothetical protein